MLRIVLGIALIAVVLAPPAFAHPGSNIVVDDQGRVFFVDTAAGVWELDTSGKLTLVSDVAWHFMAADRQGRYANATYRQYFHSVPIKGSQLVLVLCSDFPVTVGSGGNLYYAKSNEVQPGVITLRRPDGTESAIVKLPNAPPMSFVTGLTSAPDGNLYATIANNEVTSLWKISAHGDASKVLDWAAPESVRSEPLEGTHRSYARDLTVDTEGSVYLAACGIRSVAKITPGGVVTLLYSADAPWVPCGVALHNAEIYVLEYDIRGNDGKNWLPRVRKIAKDGAVTTLATVIRSQAK